MQLLRRRAFALLFAGMAVNAIGSWTALTALWGFAAYRFDASAGAIAVVVLAWSVPAALVGPLAGVPIDRFGPRRVLVAGDALAAVAALLLLTADSYHDLIWLGALQGLGMAFSYPAAAALPPRLVDDEDLASANALLGAAEDSAIVFGPLIAAGSIALWGFHAAFLIDALTYLVGIAVVVRLPLRDVPAASGSRFREDVVAGVRLTVRSRELTLTMVLSAAVFLTWGAYAVVEPIYVRDVLGRSTTVFALMQVAFGVGLVSAGFLVSRLGERAATLPALAVSVLLSGIAAAVYVGTESVVVAMAGVALWGVDVAFFGAPARTLLQRHAPPEAQGRVLALHTTLESWGELIALPTAGALAAVAGVQVAALAFAALAIAVGSAGLVAARRLDAQRGRLVAAPLGVVETGVDPVTSRFSGARSAN